MYIGFDDKRDLANQFDISLKSIESCNILFASYGGYSYEGDAVVILTKDDKVYEVHGGHCSCNGLEGQWDEEETTWDILHARYITEDPQHNSFASEHSIDAYVELKATIEYEIAERHLLGL